MTSVDDGEWQMTMPTRFQTHTLIDDGISEVEDTATLARVYTDLLQT